MNRKTIEIPVYYGKVIVILVDNLSEVEEEYNCTSFKGFDAVTFKNILVDSLEIIAVFDNEFDLNIIVHECVHIVNILFKHKCIELDLVNDENQAYWTSYFFKEIHNFLESQKIKKFNFCLCVVYLKCLHLCQIKHKQL